jgi:hypothetical protein
LVFHLKPGEVHYYEISVPSASANTRFVNADDFKIWDKTMGERSNQNTWKNIKNKARIHFIHV